MKRYIKSSTAYKRIARTDEFDNGYVLHGDWKKMSNEEAEELAKQASIENPGKIYYVQYDDLMNAASDIKWVNGESYTTYKDALDASRGRTGSYIKSDSGLGKDSDIFMLMDYYADIGPDTSGMDGDDFSCLGKFFAKDLATAKREFETLKQKYPWLKKDYRSTKYSVHSYYVDNYSEYFDSFPDSESDIDMNPSSWGGVKYNVFPDLETLIKYLGLDKEPYPGDYGEDDELPFTI